MTKSDKPEYIIEVNKAGHLVLSPEMISRYAFKPGVRIRVTESDYGLQLQIPSRLAKLYIEPTNQCNLNCRMCVHNVWSETQGMMSGEVFSRVIDGLHAFLPVPTIVFGGFGEPLFHPDIIEMVAEVKALGAPVELVTNGTLLTRDISQKLIKSGLDRLWISLDGATPESYADIRLGAALPQVLENLSHFRNFLYKESGYIGCSGFVGKTRLGIVFVAMKRNIADLPAVIDIGRRFDADRFLVTNILPYTKDLVDEVLYYDTLHNNYYGELNLPGIDFDETTYMPIFHTIRSLYGPLSSINFEKLRDRCPFIESGAGAISWDGSLSPCLPLMHSHTSYLGYLDCEERFLRRWAIGNIMEHNLLEIWNTPEHLAFRERVQAFDLSPCTTCGGCSLLDKNEEDCFGNTFPTCGGCPWAQGVIRCP